jgi:hypothetical protein
MVQCHDVTIKRKLNGWLVQVGCREFVFSLSQEERFYELLRVYFRDPEKAKDEARLKYEYGGEIEPAATPPTEMNVLAGLGRPMAQSEACEQPGRRR